MRERSSSHRGKRAHASGRRRRQQFGERAARTRDVGRRASTRARGRRPAGSVFDATRRARCHSAAASAARCRSVSAHAPRARSGRHDEIALLCSSGGSSARTLELALHRSRTPALSPRGTAARICCYTHTHQCSRCMAAAPRGGAMMTHDHHAAQLTVVTASALIDPDLLCSLDQHIYYISSAHHQGTD